MSKCSNCQQEYPIEYSDALFKSLFCSYKCENAYENRRKAQEDTYRKIRKDKVFPSE